MLSAITNLIHKGLSLSINLKMMLSLCVEGLLTTLSMWLVSGTSNWSEDYFNTTAGVGLVISQTQQSLNSTRQTVQEQLKGVFDRDWNSKYAINLDELEHHPHCAFSEKAGPARGVWQEREIQDKRCLLCFVLGVGWPDFRLLVQMSSTVFQYWCVIYIFKMEF